MQNSAESDRGKGGLKVEVEGGVRMLRSLEGRRLSCNEASLLMPTLPLVGS